MSPQGVGAGRCDGLHHRSETDRQTGRQAWDRFSAKNLFCGLCETELLRSDFEAVAVGTTTVLGKND